MQAKLVFVGVLVILLGVVTASALFTVHETEQALILQFGEPKRVIQEPGLNAKIPFIQDVVILDRRVLDVDPPIEEVILADQKRLKVDSFARYHITNPLKFYQSVGTEAIVEQRLSSIVRSALRRVLGSVTLAAVLSDERTEVMGDIRDQVNAEAVDFGTEIVDVRIRRADLPEETSQSIYARMRSEREREAAEFRAQGQEQSQQIRSRADRERTVILAEAQQRAQTLRGEGDNQSLRILAEATAVDPEFYGFYRSLEAYRNSLRADETTYVLSPTGDFFRYFRDISARPSGPGANGKAADVVEKPSVPGISPRERTAPEAGPDTAANASVSE